MDDPLGHIITASVISAPAATMIALIMVSQKTAATSEEIELSVEYKSLMDAITKGSLLQWRVPNGECGCNVIGASCSGRPIK